MGQVACGGGEREDRASRVGIELGRVDDRRPEGTGAPRARGSILKGIWQAVSSYNYSPNDPVTGRASCWLATRLAVARSGRTASGAGRAPGQRNSDGWTAMASGWLFSDVLVAVWRQVASLLWPGLRDSAEGLGAGQLSVGPVFCSPCKMWKHRYINRFSPRGLWASVGQLPA